MVPGSLGENRSTKNGSLDQVSSAFRAILDMKGGQINSADKVAQGETGPLSHEHGQEGAFEQQVSHDRFVKSSNYARWRLSYLSNGRKCGGGTRHGHCFARVFFVGIGHAGHRGAPVTQWALSLFMATLMDKTNQRKAFGCRLETPGCRVPESSVRSVESSLPMTSCTKS